MQIFLNQYILHYLNYILTMPALWVQNRIINRLYILQKKALRIINFAHSTHQFHYSKIIKIADKVKFENCLFINKYTNNKLPSIFIYRFTFLSMPRNYQTSFASKGNLQIPHVQTTYEEKCFRLYGYKILK